MVSSGSSFSTYFCKIFKIWCEGPSPGIHDNRNWVGGEVGESIPCFLSLALEYTSQGSWPGYILEFF